MASVRSLAALACIASLPGSVLPGQKKLRPIAGRVLGVDGEPAAGAMVTLRWRVHPELPGMIGRSLGDLGLAERELPADARGRFRFESPHRGPFLLLTRVEERRESSARAFPVMAGEFRTLRLEPSFFMAGKVLTRAGKPAAGATVRLVPADSAQWSRPGLYREPERRSVTTTDAKGRFELFFEHGYLRSPRWSILTGLRAEHGRLASGPIEIQRPTAGSRDLTLRLGAQATARGRFVAAGSGKPVAGALVVDPLIPTLRKRTDDRGRVELAAPTTPVWVLSNEHAPTPLTLPPIRGEDAAYADLALLPGNKFRCRLKFGGAPIADARVLLAMPQGSTPPIEWLTKTDAKGALAIDNAPAALLVGFVELDGVFVEFVRANVTEVPVPETIDVAAGRTVTGKVLDDNRLPVAGARVALYTQAKVRLFRPRITYTDRGGRFRFEHVPFESEPALAAQVAVAAGARGYTGRAIGVDDLAKPIELRLGTGKTVTGVVLAPNGKPAPNAWVTLYGTRSPYGTFVPAPRYSMLGLNQITDEQGRFTFAGLSSKASDPWTLIGSCMHEGAHCNYSTTASAGKSYTLKTTVQNK